MSLETAFEADELPCFRLSHVLRLVGENQYLLGSGTIAVATDLALHLEAAPVADGPVLSFSGARAEATDRLAARWQAALAVAADTGCLDEMAIRVDFGPLWDICPPEALLVSPALAAALAVVVSERNEGTGAGAVQMAELACRLLEAVRPEEAPGAGRFYAEALMSIQGGAGYVEPGGRPLNVQQLLPPESLLLALAPGIGGCDAAQDERLRQALARVAGEGADVMAAGEAGLLELFRLPAGVLDEDQTAMLYGLLRVRQMA